MPILPISPAQTATDTRRQGVRLKARAGAPVRAPEAGVVGAVVIAQSLVDAATVAVTPTQTLAELWDNGVARLAFAAALPGVLLWSTRGTSTRPRYLHYLGGDLRMAAAAVVGRAVAEGTVLAHVGTEQVLWWVWEWNQRANAWRSIEPMGYVHGRTPEDDPQEWTDGPYGTWAANLATQVLTRKAGLEVLVYVAEERVRAKLPYSRPLADVMALVLADAAYGGSGNLDLVLDPGHANAIDDVVRGPEGAAKLDGLVANRKLKARGYVQFADPDRYADGYIKKAAAAPKPKAKPPAKPSQPSLPTPPYVVVDDGERIGPLPGKVPPLPAAGAAAGCTILGLPCWLVAAAGVGYVVLRRRRQA
jgi:hypothetical protein